MTIWRPNVTVAAVIEQDGRFLLVEEKVKEGVAFNQPAGHLEQGESLQAAVVREVMEETRWGFEPQHLIGVYSIEVGDTTYLRFAFTGKVTKENAQLKLDPDIIQTHWLTYNDIIARKSSLRTPLVTRCIDDYLAGKRYDLQLLCYET